MKRKFNNFKSNFVDSKDMKFLEFDNDLGNFSILFQERLFDYKKLVTQYLKYFDTFDSNQLESIFPGVFNPIEFDEQTITKSLFEGQALLLNNKNNTLYMINIDNVPRRNPEDPIGSNNSLTSSRDGFVESIGTNIGLIRNRIKSPDLKNTGFVKGTYSKTSISLLYIEGLTNPEYPKRIIKELEEFECDALVSIHMLKERFNNSKLYPTIAYTGKPDRAVASLMQGRCIIVIDNFPLVLILPVSITSFLAFSDEEAMPKYYTYFTRFLSFLAVFISIYSLGIITSFILHHQKNVSLVLLVAIRFNREGVPFSFGIETLMIMIIFELYIYASSRAPQLLIQSVLVIVGGIIISQSLVSSSFASIISMVIVAFPFISSFIIANNVLLQYSFTVQRIFIFLLSIFLGLFGVICGALVLLVYAYNSKSLGEPYLAPIAPFNKEEFAKFMAPRNKKTNKTRTSLTRPLKKDLRG